MKKYYEFINEQYHQDDSRKYKINITINDHDSPYYRRMQEINAEQNIEVQKVYAKFNKMKSDAAEDLMDETIKYIKNKLVGKTLYYTKYLSDYGNNFKNFINEVVDVECNVQKIEKDKENDYFRRHGHPAPRIIIELIFKNGEKLKLNYNNGNLNYDNFLRCGGLFNIDPLLNHLKKNIGRDLSFNGAKMDDVKGYMKKRPRTKTIQKNFFDHTGEHTVKITSVGIGTFPKIGDFIIINNEYLFDIDKRFVLTLRRIGIHDPYGEENWADEEDNLEPENRWWDN